MSPSYPFEFTGQLSRHYVGLRAGREHSYTVAYVPADVLGELGAAYRPKVRIEGQMGQVPFNAALIPSRGQVYIIAPKALIQQKKTLADQSILIQFKITEQQAVDVPPALQRALEEHPWAQEAWGILTPSKQRSLCYRVSMAKAQGTIKKRVAEVLDGL